MVTIIESIRKYNNSKRKLVGPSKEMICKCKIYQKGISKKKRTQKTMTEKMM